MRILEAVALLLLCLPLAAQTRDEALAGDWWDDKAAERITLFADGSAELRGHEYYDLVKGTWHGTKAAGVTIDWTEVVRPEWDDRPREVEDWTLAFTDGALAGDASGQKRSFRPATVESREKELADLIHALIPLELGLKDEKSPRKRVELRKKRTELSSRLRFGALLVKKEGKAYEKGDAMVLRLLKAHHPEDVEGFEKLNVRGKDVDCVNRLKQLSVYLALYESKFKKWPAKLEDTKRPDMATDEKLFHCPVLGEKHLYKYVYPEKEDETSPDALTLYCDGVHPNGERCFALFSGRALSVAEADYQQALKAGSFEKLFPLIDGAVVSQKPDGDDVVLTVRFTARNLKTCQDQGKEMFFVSAEIEFTGMDGRVEKEPELFEKPGTGDSVELELSIKVPKSALSGGGGSVNLDIIDEATGRRAGWYERVSR